MSTSFIHGRAEGPIKMGSEGVSVAFGDTVRIRDLPATRDLGFAGLLGQVYGITTPSSTGIEAIGPATEDCAIKCALRCRDESDWLRNPRWPDQSLLCPWTTVS